MQLLRFAPRPRRVSTPACRRAYLGENQTWQAAVEQRRTAVRQEQHTKSSRCSIATARAIMSRRRPDVLHLGEVRVSSSASDAVRVLKR